MSERDTRVEEIRARWAKATPGPWVVQRNGLRQSCGVETADGTPIQMRRGGPWGAEGTTDPDDAAIAHAPKDIAWLLAEVERLAAEMDLAREEIEAQRREMVELRRERDAAQAEVERLRAERDEAAMAPDGLAAIFGTLFEFVLDYSGGTPSKRDPEEWLSECRIPANAVRDRLRSLAQEYPFEWREMDLHRDQLRWLGLKPCG